MKFYTIAFLCFSTVCNGQQITSIPITTGVNSSFRGLSIVNDKVAWVSGSKGWLGRSVDGGKNWTFTQLKGYEKLDFRSIYAFNKTTAIIANAGSPAHILKTTDGGENWNEVYVNNDKNAFIDGVDFWNAKEGIIFGDPINSRMLLLKTLDQGETWTEQPESNRPQLNEGEASFAASGTTVRCVGDKTVVIATGGKISRLWISDDKGANWKTTETPILQGQPTQGIFSVAVSEDQKTAVIVGGDFQQDSLKKDHVFYTLDGGLHWNSPITPTRGYRECVEYITSNMLIATGPTGTDVSYDGGKNWSASSDEKSFHVIRKARKGKLVVLAGGEGKLNVVKINK